MQEPVATNRPRPILRTGLAGRIDSFRFAMRGLGVMIRSQKNAWIHATMTVMVVATGLLCGLSMSEWSWIILSIVAVWTAEALNTAFEFLADAASPGFHPLVEKSKDVAAGAVLIAALGAVAIGLLVLGPHLWKFAQKLAGL